MFRNILRIVFLLLLPFGAMACTRKPPAVPTSTVSYETAMEAITELSEKMKDGEARLTKLEQGTDSSVLERLTTMEEALEEIVKFRTENPGHFGRVTDTTFTDKLKFECVGEVSGFGQRDLFKLGSKTLFCTQPGIIRPQDGSVCFNIPGTKFWDCGEGQILRECIHCGCGTPTNTPNVPTNTPTATAIPPTGVPPTATAVPPTAVPPTGVPPTVAPTATPIIPSTATWTPQPVPTNEPPPEGTKICLTCLFSYEVDVLTGHEKELGFWVKETPKECAFEHHAYPGKFTFICPEDFICTIDTTTDFLVVEGSGQFYSEVYAATIRWMPNYPSWENLGTVFEGEWCFATTFVPKWREGRNLRAEDATGNKMKFPIPSAERCAIRNAP